MYLRDQYEIYENVYGEYRIMDKETEDLLTVGGSPLVCDSYIEAEEFIESLKSST